MHEVLTTSAEFLKTGEGVIFSMDSLPETEKNLLARLEAIPGIIFFPKRELKIPDIDLTKLYLQDEEQRVKAQEASDVLVSYLTKGLPIYWETENHDQRRKLYGELERKFPDLFRSVCEEHNQFRRNVMTGVCFAMQFLAFTARRNDQVELYQNLREISFAVSEKINGAEGTPYQDMTDPQDKLGVVHFVENRIIEYLKVIGREPADECPLPKAA